MIRHILVAHPSRCSGPASLFAPASCLRSPSPATTHLLQYSVGLILGVTSARESNRGGSMIRHIPVAHPSRCSGPASLFAPASCLRSPSPATIPFIVGVLLRREPALTCGESNRGGSMIRAVRGARPAGQFRAAKLFARAPGARSPSPATIPSIAVMSKRQPISISPPPDRPRHAHQKIAGLLAAALRRLRGQPERNTIENSERVRLGFSALALRGGFAPRNCSRALPTRAVRRRLLPRRDGRGACGLRNARRFRVQSSANLRRLIVNLPKAKPRLGPLPVPLRARLTSPLVMAAAPDALPACALASM